MSRLRQKAKTVRQKGAERRRDWDIDPESLHWKIYSWWQAESGKYVERENFCHYWRVCLIWAPLRWMGMTLMSLVMLRPVRYILSSAAVVTFVIAAIMLKWHVVPIILGGVAAIVYLVFGVLVGMNLVSRLLPDDFGDWKQRWLQSRGMTVQSAALIAAAPIVLVMYLLAALLGLLIGLEEDYDLYTEIWDQIRRFGRWTVQAHASDRVVLDQIRPWLVIPLGLSVWSVWSVRLRLFLIGIAVIVVAFLVICYVSDIITEKRKKQKAERERQAEEQEKDELRLRNRLLLMQVTPMLERLFVILHPRWKGDEDRFNSWLQRYYRHWGSYENEIGGWDIFRWATDRYVKRYGESIWAMWNELTLFISEPEPEPEDEEAVTEPAKPRPRRLRAVLRGSIDMFALVWQVIVTKKWGICPLVKLPE